MNNPSDLEYKRHVVVVLIKSCLSVARRILPKSFYDHLYDFGFSVYRKILRLSYARKLLYSYVSGDQETYVKKTTVLKVMPYSLVGTSGLEATYDIMRDVETKELPGSIVECGVAQGGSAALMSLVSERFGKQRMIWLFDSFEGLPEPTDHDFINNATGLHIRELPKGSCLGTQEQVEELLFEKMALSRQRINLVKGWFQDSVLPQKDRVGKIAVLRIDADWYESVQYCLEHLYGSVVAGGYVIIDDYGSCFGARKAVDEFLEKHKLHVTLVPDGRGGCHFIKPS